MFSSSAADTTTVNDTGAGALPTRTFSQQKIASSMAVALLLAACSTGEDPAPDPGTIELVIAPTSIDLVQGENGHAEVTIARGGAFTGAVALSVSGSPAGVGVSFSKSLIDAGSTTAMLNVAVDAAVATGTKIVEIRAVGDGPARVTATSTLTIAVIAAAPHNLELAIVPATIELAPGASRQVEIAIARRGSFTGPVSLLDSLPTGVEARFSNNFIEAGATTATLVVAVDAGVVPGTRTVVIRAVSDNSASAAPATATLTVVVIAPSGSVTLAADSAMLAAAAGGTDVTSAVAISRTASFAGPVDLTVTGAPAGVTATMSPGIAAGATAILSVSAAPEVRNGTYALMVRGTGAGVADAVTFVALLVTGGSPRPYTISLDPAALAVTAGGASATSVVTLTPRFSRGVALYTSGAPAGLNVTLARRLLIESTTMTVQADPTVVAGTYVIRLMGEYNGVPWASAAIPVVVTAVSARRP